MLQLHLLIQDKFESRTTALSCMLLLKRNILANAVSWYSRNVRCFGGGLAVKFAETRAAIHGQCPQLTQGNIS